LEERKRKVSIKVETLLLQQVDCYAFSKEMWEAFEIEMPFDP